MAARAGVDAVGDNFLRQLGIGGFGLFNSSNNGRVQIGNAQFFLPGQLSDELAVTREYGVVTAFELRRLRHIIIWRGLNDRNANAGQFLFYRVDDALVALRVGIENLFIESLIGTVIHAEHDGHDSGFVGKDITPQPSIDGSAAAARDAIAAPSGVDKTDIQ